MRKITQGISKYPDVLDLEQLIELLGITEYAARKLFQQKKIKSFQLNGQIYKIPKVWIKEYLQSEK